MRTIKKLSGLLLLLFIFSACDKDDDDEKINYAITATASPSQEVPAVTNSTGSGAISGTYNKNTNMLMYTATWTGLSGNATNMHFHGPANVGEPAGVAVGITGFTNTTSGSVTNSIQLSEAQEADMLAGKWYYNVHTGLNPGGEIRGQVAAN